MENLVNRFMVYRVFISDTLQKKIDKFAPHLKNRLEKLKKSLEKNPTGKSLRHDYLREKKWGPFRIYFLVIQEVLIVFLLELSGKKDQQKVINDILSNLNDIIADIKRKYG